MAAPVPTPPSGPDMTAHALSVLDFAAKLIALLGAIWVAVWKIAKPYVKWRRDHHRELTVDVLAPELKQLKELTELLAICREIRDGQQQIRERQDRIFDEMDLFHRVAHENSDRHDEMNALLDELGFTSDRRRATAAEQRRKVEALLVKLKAHAVARARGEDPPDDGIAVVLTSS